MEVLQVILKMKAKNSQNNSNTLINSNYLYLIILVIVLIYFFSENKILNIPVFINFTRILISVFLVCIFFLLNVKYKKSVSRRKVFFTFLKENGLNFIVLVFVCQISLGIPFNYLVRSLSKNNKLETISCPITNVITTNIDKIYFTFKGKQYSRYYRVNEYNREELINGYLLNVQVRKSIFNTYYIERTFLKENSDK